MSRLNLLNVHFSLHFGCAFKINFHPPCFSISCSARFCYMSVIKDRLDITLRLERYRIKSSKRHRDRMPDLLQHVLLNDSFKISPEISLNLSRNIMIVPFVRSSRSDTINCPKYFRVFQECCRYKRLKMKEKRSDILCNGAVLFLTF